MINRKKRIERIVEFVSHHPASHASQTVTRRVLKRSSHEFSDELAATLRNRLQQSDSELVDFCYYLVK